MKTKTHKRQSNCRLIAFGLFSSVPLYLFFGATSAKAQMGLADDMANELESASRAQQAQMTDYTFKSGDFRMLLTPALSVQWNNNINLTESGQESDFIFLPTVGAILSYPLTDRNLLQLNVTVGYSQYAKHTDLSSWYLQTGSGLSFNFAIKDVLLNVHDQFSYVQDSSQNAQVAGTGSYGTFNNTAGLSANWDLKYVDTTVGYDYQNTIATSSQFKQNDNSIQNVYAKIGYKVNSKLTAGVEGTAAYTDYTEDILNNNASYSAGVYGDWQPDKYIHVTPRFGYVIAQFQQTSQFVQTSDLNSWYADLNISHQITKSLNYTLDAGRNISLGVQADANEYWYLNGNVSWSFIKNFSFAPNFFYQHGNQGIGSTVTAAPPTSSAGLVSETYDWYGGGIAFNYNITKRFVTTLSYTITQRTSSVSGRGYTQNVVGIQFTYRPI